jgi:hypothetical protein
MRYAEAALFCGPPFTVAFALPPPLLLLLLVLSLAAFWASIAALAWSSSTAAATSSASKSIRLGTDALTPSLRTYLRRAGRGGGVRSRGANPKGLWRGAASVVVSETSRGSSETAAWERESVK